MKKQYLLQLTIDNEQLTINEQISTKFKKYMSKIPNEISNLVLYF